MLNRKGITGSDNSTSKVGGSKTARGQAIFVNEASKIYYAIYRENNKQQVSKWDKKIQYRMPKQQHI